MNVLMSLCACLYNVVSTIANEIDGFESRQRDFGNRGILYRWNQRQLFCDDGCSGTLVIGKSESDRFQCGAVKLICQCEGGGTTADFKALKVTPSSGSEDMRSVRKVVTSRCSR